DLPAEIAFVDRAGALGGELLQRRPEVAENEPVAGDQTRTTAVDPPAIGRVSQDQVEDRVQVGLRTGQLDPSARELERRFEEARPRHRSVRPVRSLQAGDRPGDRTGAGSDPEDLAGAAVE